MGSVTFTLRQVEIFVAVARTRSITKAAEAMHLSPSAVSAAITELEGAVGVQLCVRRQARGVQLTPEGRTFERLGTELIDDASELRNAVAEEFTGQLHGSLRVGCFSPLSATFLPPLLEEYTSRHPLVDISLAEAGENSLKELMLDGLIDVAIGYTRTEHAELVSMPLASRRPHVIFGEGHPMLALPEVRWRDLADEPLILLEIGDSAERIMSWFRTFDVSPRVRWVTHDIELTRAVVGRGLGYAILMQRQHHDLTLDSRRIHSRELTPAVEPTPVYLSTSRSAGTTTRVAAFIELARRTAGELPAWSGIDQ